jgi:hypothetical protein
LRLKNYRRRKGNIRKGGDNGENRRTQNDICERASGQRQEKWNADI